MTAREIINRAAALLGYTDGSGTLTPGAQLTQRAIIALNAAYSDLWYISHNDGFTPVLLPDDEIKLDERALNDVLPYGTAAFLARSENDGDQQQYFVSIYSQKRAALTRTEAVADVIPTVDED